MNIQEATANWGSLRPQLEAAGAVFPSSVRMLMLPEWKRNFHLAMDAQPALTTDPSSAILSLLTTTIDPEVTRIIFAPNKGAEILGEEKKGSWVDQTWAFPVVENTGEVSSYGDYNENGSTNANVNFPQRQVYIFQTILQYGDLELERMGLAKLNWVSELNGSAALSLNKAQNYTYFFGVANLQNYGILNDPNLTASLTPSTKAAGGTTWFVNGVPNATANEVYNDIIALFEQAVKQTAGTVDAQSTATLAMDPSTAVALTFTNSFNVNVEDLLKKNFPNLTVKTAVQYGALSSSNPQGVVGGNFLQLIFPNVEGQKTGYCAFNEKMKAFPIIRAMSSFRQKQMSGSWGAIIRFPAGIASMLGV